MVCIAGGKSGVVKDQLGVRYVAAQLESDDGVDPSIPILGYVHVK
jgi:hypothetical protein